MLFHYIKVINFSPRCSLPPFSWSWSSHSRLRLNSNSGRESSTPFSSSSQARCSPFCYPGNFWGFWIVNIANPLNVISNYAVAFPDTSTTCTSSGSGSSRLWHQQFIGNLWRFRQPERRKPQLERSSTWCPLTHRGSSTWCRTPTCCGGT